MADIWTYAQLTATAEAEIRHLADLADKAPDNDVRRYFRTQAKGMVRLWDALTAGSLATGWQQQTRESARLSALVDAICPDPR